MGRVVSSTHPTLGTEHASIVLDCPCARGVLHILVSFADLDWRVMPIEARHLQGVEWLEEMRAMNDRINDYRSDTRTSIQDFQL